MSQATPPRAQQTESVRDYFDARTRAYDEFYDAPSAFQRWFSRTFRKAVYLRRDEVLTLAQRFNCKTILDVGCGSGRNTVWWAQRGVERLHGVDFSAEMIQQANALAAQAGVADRCTFEVADFLQWKTDRQFDLAAACGVFDYVIDAETLLRHMAKYTRRAIYGSFPGWTLVRTPLRKIRYTLRGCPTHFYRRKDLEQIFSRVGFGETEIKPISSGYLAWAYKS